nr:cytochrome P450 714C2-like [Setaria viridis]
MGILTSNGELWEHQRKVIAPELFMEKVKGMLHVMVEAAMPMLTSWENIFGREGGSAEIVVDVSLRNFSADVISRTSFGNNFAAGKEIFNKIRQLQIAMAKQSILGVPGPRLPGIRHWPLATASPKHPALAPVLGIEERLHRRLPKEGADESVPPASQ